MTQNTHTTTGQYAPPTTIKEAYARWENGAATAPEQAPIRAAVDKALDKALFYTREFNQFVAEYLGVTDEQRKAASDKVEGGAFGMEVYLARNVIEKERADAANAQAGARLLLNVGEKIGKIKLNDGKMALAATVEKLGRTTLTLIAKRGPQTIRATVPYTRIEDYAERAGNTFFERRNHVEKEPS